MPALVLETFGFYHANATSPRRPSKAHKPITKEIQYNRYKSLSGTLCKQDSRTVTAVRKYFGIRKKKVNLSFCRMGMKDIDDFRDKMKKELAEKPPAQPLKSSTTANVSTKTDRRESLANGARQDSSPVTVSICIRITNGY